MFFDFIISAKKTNIILGSISIKKGNSIKPRPTWLIDTTKFFSFLISVKLTDLILLRSSRAGHLLRL